MFNIYEMRKFRESTLRNRTSAAASTLRDVREYLINECDFMVESTPIEALTKAITEVEENV